MLAPERVAAILLAAGASTRFGQTDKLLAMLDGRPVAAHAAAMLAPIGFGTLIAVCRAGDEAVSATLANVGFRIVRAHPDDDGLARSLARGIAEAARHDIDAALVCLADMPFVTAAHIGTMLDAHDADPNAITTSADQAIPMPPAIFGRTRFAALASLEGDAGARAMLAGATRIGAPPSILRDIDRPEDLPA